MRAVLVAARSVIVMMMMMDVIGLVTGRCQGRRERAPREDGWRVPARLAMKPIPAMSR
jgi:hypothetical protein